MRLGICISGDKDRVSARVGDKVVALFGQGSILRIGIGCGMRFELFFELGLRIMVEIRHTNLEHTLQPLGIISKNPAKVNMKQCPIRHDHDVILMPVSKPENNHRPRLGARIQSA